ncbi:MAG: 7-carboxy-7-deazaguanine synthase QueE [Planctomycetes bacterium]|nr:7-carboxy-7-deazaguanine synthase QueE [Planctomycetota bacterium]
MKDTLFITEIYPAIQGEGSSAGKPCAMVRLSGCDLRCVWCDTEYSFTKGEKLGIDDVIAKVRRFRIPTVEITGGEPLLQKPAVLELMRRLVADDCEVLLETGGHVDVSDVPKEVSIILDIKCPGSGESENNLRSNWDILDENDEIKFVLAGADDYEFALDLISKERFDLRVRAVHLSPVFDQLEAAELARMILADFESGRIDPAGNIRQGFQLHKYIFDPAARGV